MKTLIKITAIILIVMLVSNLILMALGKISVLLFWIILVFGVISSFIINRFLKPKL